MGRTASLALLLAALVVGGGVNYRRNVAAEASAFRPYRGVTDAELASLIEAQEREAEAAESAWKRGSRARAPLRGGDELMQQIRDFDRARQSSERKRELSLRAAGGQGDLERMQRERDLRKQQGEGWRRALYFATRF
jgi:hypothetical protein